MHLNIKLSFLSILLLILWMDLSATNNNIAAHKGVFDLSNWDFEKDGNVELNGEWEFYWNLFLMDSNHHAPAQLKYLKVPHLWDKQETNNFGYASYRLKVLLNNTDELALKYLMSSTACEIFIDGKSYHLSGKPGITKESTVPNVKPSIIVFKPQNKEVEIVLQVANFHHRKGGQGDSILLGYPDNIVKYRDKKVLFELLLIGGIIILSIFQLLIYFRRISDKPTLFFALFTFMVALRFLLTGEHTIHMLGTFNWYILMRLEYLSFYLTVLFFLLYIKGLYIEEVNKLAYRIIASLCIVFSVSAIVGSIESISNQIVYFQAITVFSCIYGFYVLYKTVINKRGGAKMFLLGFIVLFISLLHDIFMAHQVLYLNPWAPWGITIFILIQALILASRIRNALTLNEKYSTKLEEQNMEYAFLNAKFKKQNEQLLEAKLKAEESDRFKSAFLANMSHEIRTPMNGILGFASLLGQENYTTSERNEFISIINDRGHHLLNIVNDIVDISRIETGQLDIELKDVSIADIIAELYQSHMYLINSHTLRLIKNTPSSEEINIVTDAVKLKQVLDNLLSNAFKFTKNGVIEFGYTVSDSELKFFVKDTGIGMDSREREVVFGRFNQANDQISQIYGGTGLGLTISKAYVEKLGGNIWVESKKGIGSTFFFTIPRSLN